MDTDYLSLNSILLLTNSGSGRNYFLSFCFPFLNTKMDFVIAHNFKGLLGSKSIYIKSLRCPCKSVISMHIKRKIKTNLVLIQIEVFMSNSDNFVLFTELSFLTLDSFCLIFVALFLFCFFVDTIQLLIPPSRLT